MALLEWFRGGRAEATSRQAGPPVVMAPAAAPVPRLHEISMDAAQLVSAWRPAAGRIVLSLPDAPRDESRLAARLTCREDGQSIGLSGTIIEARRDGASWRVEVRPDEERLASLRLLVASARGDAPNFRPRAPRYIASLPAVVTSASGAIFMTTFSISEGGCGLVWTGPLPRLGGGLHLRLGTGARSATFRGMACWSSGGPQGGARAGIRFLAGQEEPWARLLDEVRRTGVLPL